MLLRDRKGEREENERRRIVSVVKGESIVSVATNEREMEMKKQVTTQWEETLFSIPLFQQARMKTKSKDLSFIHRTFEGRLNPKLALRPLSPI